MTFKSTTCVAARAPPNSTRRKCIHWNPVLSCSLTPQRSSEWALRLIDDFAGRAMHVEGGDGAARESRLGVNRPCGESGPTAATFYLFFFFITGCCDRITSGLAAKNFSEFPEMKGMSSLTFDSCRVMPPRIFHGNPRYEETAKIVDALLHLNYESQRPLRFPRKKVDKLAE